MNRFLLFLSSFAFLLMIACNNENSEPSERSFSILNDWSDIERTSETGLWLIYFYHPGCPACAEVEPDVKAFNNLMGEQYPVYLAHSHQVTGTRPDADIRYVPTIVVVEGNNYQSFHTGVPAIRSLLGSLTENDD